MFSVKGMMFAVAALAVVFLAGCARMWPEPLNPSQASAPGKDTEPRPFKVSWKTTKLGQASDLSEESRFIISVSPDGRRYASEYWDSNGQATIIVDGVAGRTFNETSWVVWSGDSRHVAYAGTTEDGKTFLVTDGEEKAVAGSVRIITFSPDSGRLAYVLTVGEKDIVVIDGVETAVDGTVDDFTFSPDSKRTAYFVEAGEERFVVVDGEKGKEFDGIKNAPEHLFSSNSQRYAYTARIGEKWTMVVDGVEGKQYDKISAWQEGMFSPDGQHIFYAAHSDFFKSYLVLDAEEIEGGMYPPAFSPDGKHVAYAVKKGDKTECVVRDGKDEETHDHVTALTFSPDSEHLGYFGFKGGDSFPVIDNVAGKVFAEADPCTAVIFSPDSRRTAFGIRKKVFDTAYVVDGKEYVVRHRELSGLTIFFSADSEHVVCVETAGEMRHLSVARSIMIDGIERSVFKMKSMWDPPHAAFMPVFSPDSKHVVYRGGDSNGRDPGEFVVDTQRMETGIVPMSAPIFDSANKFHFIGVKDGEVFLVECEISE